LQALQVQASAFDLWALESGLCKAKLFGGTDQMEYVITAIVSGLAIGFFVYKAITGRVTVFEFERALKYYKGKFKKVLDPGLHRFLRRNTKIRKIDVRPHFVTITGQEVLTSDSVSLKISLAAKYEVADPNVAVNTVEDYHAALYLELQLALREIIGNAEIDDLLAKRGEFSVKLMGLTEKKAEELGLKLHSVSIKDIMFPGQLKQMFAQIVNARKQGQAALEKARGETAAMRNLANAAKLVKDNPALMQLRMLQSLGESSGNTLVFGMPQESTPLVIRTKDQGASDARQIQSTDTETSQ